MSLRERVSMSEQTKHDFPRRDSHSSRKTSEPLYRTNWRERESLVLAVSEAVASVSGQAPDEIEPIFHSVDIAALRALVRSDTEDQTTVVQFDYGEYEIEVCSSGQVSLWSRS